jgi:polysaccharide biosynthesis transport protein
MKQKKLRFSHIQQKLNEAREDSELRNAAPHGDNNDESKGSHPAKQPPPSDNQEASSKQERLPEQPVYESRNNTGTPPRRPRNGSKTQQIEAATPTVAPQAPPVLQSGAPAHSLPLADDEEEEKFDIFRYLNLILRRKTVIILTTIATFLFALYSYMNADRHYSTRARLLYRPNEQNMISEMRGQYWADRQREFITHLDLLRSRNVLSMVAENLENRVKIHEILQGIQIKQANVSGQQTDIIEILFQHPNAELARDVVNELCRTYIDYRRDVNGQEISRLVFKFENQIKKLQKELEKKESTLREFKERNKMVQLSSETNLVLSKLSNMELALQETQLGLIEDKERMISLQSQIGQQELDIVQSITYRDPIQNKLADLELELNTLSAELSPEHYKVKAVKQQIENLKTAMIEEVTTEAASRTLIKNPIRQSLLQELVQTTIQHASLETKRTAQEKIIEKLNQELLHLPSLEQRYAFLHRETESLLQTLRMLKTNYEEAKVKRDSQEADLKILELAQTPRIAIPSVKISILVVGIFIGIVLGILLALVLEYLDQSIKEPGDMEKTLELPLLGVVPFIESEKAVIHTGEGIPKNAMEPFRALRANIKHLSNVHDLRTFIVCSAVKGEGKTTLAANLAITFALDGKKVILVDGDLRRSQIHNIFGMPKEIGLSDYLSASKELDDIIKPTIYENLSVVTSGERPHNSAELLGTYRFDVLIKEIYNRGDIIIFDSPALLPVSDTLIMAPKMEACMMVVRNFWTPLKAALQTKNQLKRMGCRIFGGIFNGVSHSRGYYPYYYGYYGYYSYKYSYEDDIPKRFSLREFGLQFERRIRDIVNNGSYSLMRSIPKISRSAQYIIGRKTFWLLLLTLIGLIGVRIWLQSRPKEKAMDSIEYIGIGNDNEHDAIIVEDPLNSGIPLERSYRINESSVKVPPLSNEIKTSTQQWITARSSGDHSRYYAFYDSLRFSYDGGNLESWKKDTLQPGMQPFSQLQIDSMWQEMVNDTSAMVYTRMVPVNGNNETNHTLLTTWCKHDGKWQIIREEKWTK